LFAVMSAIAPAAFPIVPAGAPPTARSSVKRWAAVDHAAEAELEAQFNRKVTWREALLGWLIEFNRY
jgi:hypothetical protein